MGRVKTIILSTRQPPTFHISVASSYSCLPSQLVGAGSGWAYRLNSITTFPILKKQQTSLIRQVLFKSLDSRPPNFQHPNPRLRCGGETYLTSAMATKTILQDQDINRPVVHCLLGMSEYWV